MKRQRPPSLIDGWLSSRARLLERHEVRVAAPTERAYDTIAQVRLSDLPVVRALLSLRRISYSKGMTLRQFFGTSPFLILEEDPPHEVVFGVAVGWRPPAFPTPEDFRRYEREGAIRAVGNFQIEAIESGSLISTETWIETFGARARWRFRAYWLIVGPFSAFIRREFLRAAQNRTQG